ncbi:hypothetical protein diail_1062 [Diaporthe ilicicola]|nr:hypothetical protein diail_1062 [Diaporthe ilicicola]
MRASVFFEAIALLAGFASANSILRRDNGTYGPELEEFHYFFDRWPIGHAVSSTGRLFVCYTRVGGESPFTLGEAVNKTAEEAYPSADLSVPVAKVNTTINGMQFGSSNSTGLISVQALYITSETEDRPETLWVLDTGRPTVVNSNGGLTMVYGQPGGPKLVAISLKNDTIYASYTFPAGVVYPDSYLNDVRIDLRRSAVPSGKGVAYLVDSSSEGRPGFVMLDLGTGESWRRLDGDRHVLRADNDVPSYNGQAFYQVPPGGGPFSHNKEGNNGVSLSPDLETMYFTTLTGNVLYSVPTANLLTRDDVPWAEQAAKNNVTTVGQKGGNSNGSEGDSNGLIYMIMPEHNAVYYYDPKDLKVHTFVRDPRMLWPDPLAIAEDGYMYILIIQTYWSPRWNGGKDLRQLPGAVLRAKLPNNGTKMRVDYASYTSV